MDVKYWFIQKFDRLLRYEGRGIYQIKTADAMLKRTNVSYVLVYTPD